VIFRYSLQLAALSHTNLPLTQSVRSL